MESIGLKSWKGKTAIRYLNDTFRRGERQDGVVVVDADLRAMGTRVVELAKSAVRDFEIFDAQIDCTHEHSTGLILVEGVVIAFEIEYLDLVSNVSSPDPANVLVTRRVLSIRLK